jgi:uncharacterized phosphosugar-binding protein
MSQGGVSPYYRAALEVIARIERTQGEALDAAAQRIFRSLAEDGVLHIFGSGHSHAVAEEAFHRAGGLVPVNIIQEAFLTPLTSPAKSGRLERLPGIAGVLLDAADVRAGELLVVISNSGINAVPVEMAEGAKSRGLAVVAITSLAHAQSMASRAPSRQRLFEVADLVIDNCGLPGDGAVSYGGVAARVGPTSLLAGSYIINSLTCRIVERFLAAGMAPPVYASANVPGGDEHNRALEAKYRARIKGL